MKPSLGVCAYPEHWPRNEWSIQAQRMAELGLSWVRIGEFGWSRLEPQPGAFDFTWLDEAMDCFNEVGLRVMLGTPSATPPRWMLDKHPDMLAWDKEGRPRGFGSRRHYCFSHTGYRAEAAHMAGLLAERYASHPGLQAWQIDNEYGCHDTSLSYSPAARDAFRLWLAERYGSVEALNEAWGNVFWSMDYQNFDQIELPNLTVTEPNPAHVLAFRRFSSEQVQRFNLAQVEAIRAHSKAPLSHNFMGHETSFDHYALGEDLEIATWDSYPIGFLSDRLGDKETDKTAFFRQGDPDFQGFHHDLYRTVGRGRWWIMEQQPGPVNWAPYNPVPLPGMVRLWTWEALAHGAEVVSYFRWRQLPFGQEQMHAGLLRPDSHPSTAFDEVTEVVEELNARADQLALGQADAALVFDYASCWAWEAQPQARGFDGFRLALATYKALRRAGLNIDLVRPDCADLSAYPLVLAPGISSMSEALQGALEAYSGIALLGPRFDTKSEEAGLKLPMGPALSSLDVHRIAVDSFPESQPQQLTDGGELIFWRELLEGNGEVLRHHADGLPICLGGPNLFYLGAWLAPDALYALVCELALRAGLQVEDLGAGLRKRATQSHTLYFNYGPEAVILNGERIEPAGILWREKP